MSVHQRRRTTRHPGVSVSRRLTRAFTAYVLLLLLAGGLGITSVATVSSTRATETRQERLGEANTSMMLAMTSAESAVRGYRLTADPAFLAPYDAGRLRYPGEVARALASADAADERETILAQQELATYWFDELAPPVVAGVLRDGQTSTPPAQAAVFKDVSARHRALNARLDVLADRRAATAGAEADRAATAVLALSGLALLASLATAVVVHRRLHRALVVPLDAVVATLGRLAAGRHDARADADLGPSEVQAVATSLNTLAVEADRLRAEQAATAHHQGLAVEISHAVRDEVLGGDPVVEALRLLGAALGVDRVFAREIGDDGRTATERQWLRPPLSPLPATVEDEDYERRSVEDIREYYRQAAVWAVGDLDTLPDEGLVAAFRQRTGARAVIAVPVGAGDEMLGWLTVVDTQRTHAWQRYEIDLVTSAAADLGRALAVGRLLAQQERLVDQLRELDRTKTEFLSTVSHELRTPLTSIAGYVEMVREGDAGEVPPEVDAMLVVVERNTARLRQLIEDLLTLSRIESGTYRVTHEEVAVTAVASMVVQSLRPAADKARVSVALDVEPGADLAAVVSGDPGQLERAVTNLLSNAVKFTPAGGFVRLAVRLAEGRVVLEIADTGIGIPAAEQEQLFDRFFRASNATELAIPGTGLGLAIVRSIVEHHEGVLTVASVAGEGTTVTIDLPCLAGPASGVAEAAARAAVAATVASLHHHEALSGRTR